MEKLAEIATKVRTPLALAGLVVVVLYGIYKLVLGLGVFAPIGGAATYQLLSDMIDKVFWLALAAIVLGIAAYVVTLLVRQPPNNREPAPSPIEDHTRPKPRRP